MILIALGANSKGNQGQPDDTLRWVVAELPQFGIGVNSLSRLYLTDPIGVEGQDPYVNAVASIRVTTAPENLLRILKSLERKAGRRLELQKTSKRWGARPLDLDIIDFRGLVSDNYRAARDTPGHVFPLVLPHPRIEERPFVVAPLLDVAPFWHHPVSHRSAQQLWARLRRREQGRVLRSLA